MSDNPTNNQNQSDEIDLGQLFAMIGRGFNNLFKGLLRGFLYLKRNLVILATLIIVGGLLGFALKFVVGEEQKLDVIVTPNLDTKNYLYDVVAEIQSDIKSKDTVFFSSMGMDMDKMDGFKIEITPLKTQSGSGLEDEMKFLELLKDFDNSDEITDILKSELEDKTTKDQRITFYFKDAKSGKEYAQKIIDYINSNPYYTDLLKVYTENAQNRIRRNDSLIGQIDVLINNYTQKMLKEQAMTEGRLVLENQEPLNIPSLFELKTRLTRDTEEKKLELEETEKAITVVNFGKPHKVQKPLFQKDVALIPLIFVGLFFLFSFIRYLNRKAKEMHAG
ncbi:hypothetical protein [Lentiprolixibacter aurantiacus]|uniref:Uncharacterized protein n=1 Tax=Lentiprolixibacter aurantiacus TaxID=2993939 RepID=A0AAE3MJE7_9FLAO|nr:hypothetical protein [Lentiprolixibacter aurantiacus]MCX2718534.1 hypothetical protein [Lentiprolixibacter aurantiacus]